MSSIPIPLKAHHVGDRSTLNRSSAQTSSRWCGVVWNVFTIGSLARFREGRESVFDNLRSGKPVTSVSDENIEKLFKKDRQLTLCMTADELHINHESTRQIVTQNLGIRKTCCRFVPHHLTDDHKQERLEASQDFVKRANVTPNFFNCIVT
ncbi:uncharacterized protein TNCV_4600991 [Trichonephila clavipes]|nr:uncharacterized protein TNCV_4600991 [Trichonephila clavipes]